MDGIFSQNVNVLIIYIYPLNFISHLTDMMNMHLLHRNTAFIYITALKALFPVPTLSGGGDSKGTKKKTEKKTEGTYKKSP